MSDAVYPHPFIAREGWLFLAIAILIALALTWTGLWLISIGAWLQLVRLHLFGLRYQNSWPLLLIIIGAGIALKAVFDVTGGSGHES